MLLDLEKEVIAYAATRGLSLVPQVNPSQLHGLEINPYAQQLAQVVIWIGYLQWMHHNGFKMPDHPVLAPDREHPLHGRDPRPLRPGASEGARVAGGGVYCGEPAVSGRKAPAEEPRRRLRGCHVRRLWNERVPREADLCCYWFEKARRQIETRKVRRAGLLATQGIRGGANRKVLERIKATGEIFFAESDRDWILDGANVHVSMVGFDNGTQADRTLDSKPVAIIHANLGSAADTTTAKPLAANLGLSFMGDTKGGAFDIPERRGHGNALRPQPTRSP